MEDIDLRVIFYCVFYMDYSYGVGIFWEDNMWDIFKFIYIYMFIYN